MTKLFILGIAFLVLPSLLLAQGNYVVNSSNNSNSSVYGTFNTLVGPGAGASGHITGNRNTVTGYNAGISLTSGSFNSFFGVDAGEFTTSGGSNTFLGRAAGLSNTTGYNNVFTGAFAGESNTSGIYNVFTGSNAGYFNTTGSENVFAGYTAGYNNTTGGDNVFVGHQAGKANTAGFNNVFAGAYAGYYTTTSSNVFTGAYAGYYNTTGSSNMFSGPGAGRGNTTGSYNVYTGSAAGYNSNGSNNVFTGNNAGSTNTTGMYNTFVGDGAGTLSQTGSSNTFIGSRSGVTSSNPNLQNATALGYGAQVSASNSLILGSGANVGIGNTAPSTKLHLTSGVANSSGLRLENLTSSTPATVLNQAKFLTVDGSGNVILGSTNGSARLAAESWSVSGDQLQNTNPGSVVIGQGLKTPAGYKLVVEGGILTEKVKVAVKNTSEWSDYVFKPGYSLKPLSEIEQYITTHEHLPGIPSAKEMVKQGNDLHQTDAKLLEKIEELTLYSIQQDKTIQHQNEELQAMKQKQDELEQLLQQVLSRK